MYFATLNCTVPDKDIYYSGWDISSILPKIIILDSLNKNWGGGEMGIYTGLRCKVKVKMTADT